jgi:hypothetical protein
MAKMQENAPSRPGGALVNWRYDYEAPLPTPVDCL